MKLHYKGQIRSQSTMGTYGIEVTTGGCRKDGMEIHGVGLCRFLSRHGILEKTITGLPYCLFFAHFPPRFLAGKV